MFCDNPEGLCAFILNATSATNEFISSQLDVLYLGWVISLIYPTLLAIILLPFVIVALLYISSFLLYLYQHRHRVVTVLQETLEKRDPWVGGRYLVSLFWDAHGFIWHGYDVCGLENIPESGGAIIVYYHGALPIDVYYLTSRVIIQKGLLLHSIGDKFLSKVPGWAVLLEAFDIKPGTVTSCIEDVNKGKVLTISPGGLREALFSNQMYNLIWGKRTGFAKVALKTNCPIIPMFTENLRESFRTFVWPRWFWIALYERFRLPLTFIYGGFPVKLRSHLGTPVIPNPDESPEDLAKRVETSLEVLISNHQNIPGNILRALIARFYEPKKKKTVKLENRKAQFDNGLIESCDN